MVISMYIIEQIAYYLIEHGMCSTSDLAKALDLPSLRIADAMRRESTRLRYGIKCEGKSGRSTRGAPVNLWSADRRTLEQTLKTRVARGPIRVRAERKPPPPRKKPVKVPKPVYESHTPIEWTGPILTVWQPCSPYYKEQK